MKSHLVALFVVLTFSNIGQGQVSIVDGVVTLNGDFNKLSGINVTSLCGFLSRADGEVGGVIVPGQGHAPWAFGVPTFLADNPYHIAYGILGADAAIDISGATATAVLYSESQDVAAAGDLTVEPFVNGDNLVGRPPLPACETHNSIARDRFASVINGGLVLHGAFDQLAGIRVTSAGGNLSRADWLIPGTFSVGPSDAPFASADFLAQTPTEFDYGVLGAESAVDVVGVTRTAVLYGGAPGTEAADLEFVELRINGNPTPVAFPVVPEPTTGCLAWTVVVGVLLVRRRW